MIYFIVFIYTTLQHSTTQSFIIKTQFQQALREIAESVIYPGRMRNIRGGHVNVKRFYDFINPITSKQFSQYYNIDFDFVSNNYRNSYMGLEALREV